MKTLETVLTIIVGVAFVGGIAWVIFNETLRSKKAKANSAASINAQPEKSEQTPTEKSMLSTATGVMILGIIGYVITALILISSFEDFDAKIVVIFSFIFGALVFVPLIMLPYHCAKVWAETSKNARSAAEDLRAIKAVIESQNAPTANSSESTQTENALECVPPLDTE